jgi:hypothetical protein
VIALCVASNLENLDALHSAFQAVEAVRFAEDSNAFDLRRAEVIFFTSIGDRDKAIDSAHHLARESRLVNDVLLACKGLRNAAEACTGFGDSRSAQAFLHEQRQLATRLGYHAQAAFADIRLAGHCLETMDVDGSKKNVESAFELMARYGPFAPLIASDAHLQRCWTSLVAGNFGTAQHSARFVARRITGSHTGTALWTLLGVTLATFNGRPSKTMLKHFLTLKASIGSRPFYYNEQHSLTALLLFSAGTALQDETREFATSHLPRLARTGRAVWPFLQQCIDDPSAGIKSRT